MTQCGITPAMARRIEVWPLDRLVPYPRNARTHSAEQVSQIAASIAEFGFTSPILVDSEAGIIAGHGRLMAARKLGLAEVPVIVLDHLSETQRRAYILADNKLTELGGWDEALLAEELAALEAEGLDLGVIGFSDRELAALLTDDGAEPASGPAAEEEITETPAVAVTQAGDLWMIGPHRLLCGDCRKVGDVLLLMDGRRANLVVTSPPYATQREYDPSSGFQPVPPDDYIGWYQTVADNVAGVLAADGSYLLNIKEHASDGQRHLYVKKLTIAHVERWGWRFVDEFCWRKTDNGVPGGWSNRFKNAWEPVFHFCRQPEIKFRPFEVGHLSEDCFEYSPENPKSTSGSGLLGTGARGAAAGRLGADEDDGRFKGIARPSNVIEAKTESTQGSHSAPFPRALVEFFVKAYSDAGDVVFEPFTGSGTTLAAAHVHGRIGYGIEISPAYCDVILRRMADLTGLEPQLAATGEALSAVAASRGILAAQPEKPKAQVSRRIQHSGLTPHDGCRKSS
ncbi:MAG TPA: DNA methyltransferase [Bryobacteraceae bacterium]|nr:DNA methyltransferase [Bryobacteraceae bacterium]